MNQRSVILGLAAGVVTFLTVAYLCWSPDWFGQFHDDSIYLSSAKALAAGQGYVMPSVPGEPSQTKYPVFYPWLLSLIWGVWPSFPQNLDAAFWISALAGAGFFVVCFFVLRQLGIASAPALGLAAACGFHPTTLRLATSLLSDLPFMTLAVGSTVLAWAAMERLGDRRLSSLWLLAVAVAALAVMTRSSGIAFVLALVCFAGWRKSYPLAFVALAAGLLVFGAGAAWSWWNQPVFSVDSANLSGYEQTSLFYRSYLGFWLNCVPDWATFQPMAKFNAGELLKHPAAVSFLLPVVGFEGGFFFEPRGGDAFTRYGQRGFWVGPAERTPSIAFGLVLHDSGDDRLELHAAGSLLAAFLAAILGRRLPRDQVDLRVGCGGLSQPQAGPGPRDFRGFGGRACLAGVVCGDGLSVAGPPRIAERARAESFPGAGKAAGLQLDC